MKYSGPLQIVLLVALVVVCYMPWVYIESINVTLTGMNRGVPTFGRPGLMNIFFTCVSTILFFWPGIWPKRINVFVCAFNFSWAVRNFIITTQCDMGECPQKLWGIYVLMITTFMLLLLSFFPKVRLQNN